MTPPWLTFFERPFPSANTVLVRGERPILVDTGFGSDLEETEALLRAAGVPPERLSLIVNTHYHCDHAGGNFGLQSRYGVPIAAHRWEGELVNRRDPEACAAAWLRQPVEPYWVDRLLTDGDELGAGGTTLEVVHTPGHTLGHVSLYHRRDGVLLCGDAVHGDDVAWLNPFREGVGAIHRGMESLERLLGLPVRWACSGHGEPFRDPQGAFRAALGRYRRWLEDPERTAWHGMKRIFAYALMIEGGLSEEALTPYLLGCSWFHDYRTHVFRTTPNELVEALLLEMVRSQAARWQGGRLVACAPHRPARGGWPPHAQPRDWTPSDRL